MRFELSCEIGEGGLEISKKKTSFIITIRYKIPTFSSVGPFFKEEGGGLENFGQKLKFLGFFQLRLPLNPIGAGGGLNQPALFSNIHFSMKKGSGGPRFRDFS